MSRLAPTIGCCLALLSVACAAGSRPTADDDDGAVLGSSTGGKPPSDLGSTGSGGDCPPGAELVYVIDDVDTLYRFDPPARAFTAVGQISCGERPFSMAVDRHGSAWVLSEEGHLFQVSTDDASCSLTAFTVGQQGFTLFGMGFSSDGAGATTDTLFASDGTPFYTDDPSGWGGLASIDTGDLGLATIGAYDALSLSRAELTGTGDGRLFGFFADTTPAVVAEIDKGTAHVLASYPQPGVDSYSGAFAFAHWGADFWLFFTTEPDPTTSSVAVYSSSMNTTTVVLTDVPFVIVGAGVSTCAPYTPPK